MGASITARVHDYLDADGPAREMLGRDVVNVRALARWLMRTLGIEGSEEAVVSAIRRYPRIPEGAVFQRARELLSDAQRHSSSNVCAFSLPRTADVHGQLPDLFELVDPNRGELLRVVEGLESIKVIVGGSKAEDVGRRIGSRNILDKQTDLAEHAIIPPKGTRETPGVLALVHSVVASRGISVVDSVSGGNELLLFVDAEDSLQTYRALDGLCAEGRI